MTDGVQKRTSDQLNAFAAGLVVLFASVALGVMGVASAWNASRTRSKPEITRDLDHPGTFGMVVSASTRGEAEAVALGRLVDAAKREGIALRSGVFKEAPESRELIMRFDVEGPPSAAWRMLHSLENGQPAFVVTRLRITARDEGAVLALSGEVLAAWANFSPATLIETTEPAGGRTQ
jgi:hypothetical protein